MVLLAKKLNDRLNSICEDAANEIETILSGLPEFGKSLLLLNATFTHVTGSEKITSLQSFDNSDSHDEQTGVAVNTDQNSYSLNELEAVELIQILYALQDKEFTLKPL